jgi:hypothetical protein
MSVTWSLDDSLAHAEGDDPDSIRYMYATSGDGTPPSEDMLAEGDRAMKALCARIEGLWFASAEDLHRFLRSDLQLSRDFD